MLQHHFHVCILWLELIPSTNETGSTVGALLYTLSCPESVGVELVTVKPATPFNALCRYIYTHICSHAFYITTGYTTSIFKKPLDSSLFVFQRSSRAIKVGKYTPLVEQLDIASILSEMVGEDFLVRTAVGQMNSVLAIQATAAKVPLPRTFS